MPKKIQTETQFARLIGATPLQVELSLIRMTGHETKNTAAAHMEAFYRPFAEVEETGEKFDGLIITGAPIEHLPFEDVTYWDELTRVFDWTQTNVHSTFGVCWGGMAMIHHFHGVKKHLLDRQALRLLPAHEPRPGTSLSAGVFRRSGDARQPLDRDAPRRDRGRGPARPAAFRRGRPRAGGGSGHRALYIFNHLEYDSGTLNEEYRRDLTAVQVDGAEIEARPTTTPTTIPPARRRTAGAAMRTCSTATGCRRST
jgi:homoserine O-succinyltransferase